MNDIEGHYIRQEIAFAWLETLRKALHKSLVELGRIEKKYPGEVDINVFIEADKALKGIENDSNTDKNETV